MKHARSDYDRIQDPHNKIPEDEPVFLLRGQDKLAAIVVTIYAWLCWLFQSKEVSKLALDHARKMRKWPKKKIPDVPEGLAQQTNQAAKKPQRDYKSADFGID